MIARFWGLFTPTIRRVTGWTTPGAAAGVAAAVTLLVGLSAPGLASASYSTAPGWYWLNPLPTGFNQYTGASMVGDEVWVTTNGESLLHSADGGRTWTPHPTSDGTGSFDRVAFVSSSVGYATRDGVGVFRTETGGAVWNQVLDLPTEDVCDLFVLDGSDVWVQTIEPAYSYRTTNGGASWQVTSTPTTLRDVVFTDAEHGWAVGNVIALNASSQWASTSKVYATTNGGGTWTELRSAPDEVLVSIAAPDASHIVAGGTVAPPRESYLPPGSPLVVSTANGGSSWATANVAGGDGTVVALAFHDAANGWGSVAPLYEDTGHIASTADGGLSWNLFTDQGVASLACSPTGGVVGVGGVGVYQDGVYPSASPVLLAWQAGDAFVSRDPSPITAASLSDIAFGDGDHGWTIKRGYPATVWRTANGGARWTAADLRPYVGDSTFLNAVWAASPTTVWVAGSDGALLKSSNGGANWTEVDATTSDELRDVTFADADHGWAVSQSALIATVDGGATWNPNYNVGGSHAYSAVAAPSADVACVVGYDYGAQRHCIVRTANGGATWAQVLTAPEEVSLGGIVFRDALEGWAYGGEATLYHTTNGGASWQLTTLGRHFWSTRWKTVLDVAFTSSLEGWVVCEDNTDSPRAYPYTIVVHTTDGGATWETVDVGPDPRDRLVTAAVAGDRVWMAGMNSVIVANFDPDTSPPVTSVSTSYDGRWTNRPVSLTFSADDPGVGVTYTRLSVDGLPWLYWTSYTFDTPFDYANDGAHTVLYQSVDRLAQVEAPRRRLVKIDTRPPANPNAVGPAEVNGYIGPNPTFRWTSQDWGSSKLIRAETAIAAVDVVGDRAYALDGTLLRVLDLFNPETPQELGRVDLGAIGPVDVTVVGDYAYVVAQVFGLIVVDVSDPAHPVAVGGRTIRGEPTHVAVTNRFAFVTTNEGVALVALEKPTAPLQVGLIELRSVNDVAADGDALAVLAADSLVTFDVSRPASYREVGSFSFKAWPTAVSVHRDVACVAWAGGASAMSVPLEAAPSLISNLTVSGPFVDIVFTGTMATLLAPDAGAVQIDLGEPDQPIYVGWTWSVGGRTTALDATPEYIFIAEGPGGLSVAKAMQTEAASVEFDDTATTEPDFDPDGGVVSRVSYAGVDGGQKYFHVRVRDQAGNWSGTTHLAVNVDAGGPTIANNADAAWHRSFTFTASAADSQSGLASLELAVDGGPWQSVSSITLRTWTKRGGGSGVHTVICRATDRVGNAVARPAAVYLDGRAPQTTDDAPKDPADRWNPPPQPAPVTVTLSATDAHSGVARTLYSLDGRAWTEGTSVLVPAAADGSDDGLHWIGYYSEDAVGNVEYSHWVPVVIDVPSAPAVRGILRGLRR